MSPRLFSQLTGRGALIAALMAVLLSACSNNQQRTLQPTLDAYASLIRWGDFAGAFNYVHPDERPDPKRMNFELQRFEQIRVTSYQESGMSGTSPTTIVQVVELGISNRHTASERRVRDRQVWEYDEEAERWWLMSGLPDISR